MFHFVKKSTRISCSRSCTWEPCAVLKWKVSRDEVNVIKLFMYTNRYINNFRLEDSESSCLEWCRNEERKMEERDASWWNVYEESAISRITCTWYVSHMSWIRLVSAFCWISFVCSCKKIICIRWISIQEFCFSRPEVMWSGKCSQITLMIYWWDTLFRYESSEVMLYIQNIRSVWPLLSGRFVTRWGGGLTKEFHQLGLYFN